MGISSDLVIGIDSSTQSTKAIAWTRAGEAVAEGRAPIALATPGADRAEQRVEHWWAAAVTALRQVTGQIDPRRVAGLGISNQRETVAFLDKDGAEVRPAMVWLDERARGEVAPLAAAIGPERLHRISGKPIDLTPVIYRIAWLKRHEPAAFSATAAFADVHACLALRLTGQLAASWTSADPFGLLDIGSRQWSGPILDHLGLTEQRLPRLYAPGAPIGEIREAAAADTGLAAGTRLFAAGGDGQCAGLGVNATRAGIIYLNLGTAIITGAWGATPEVGPCWRTMTSPTGTGYFYEGVQRAGAHFLNWFVDNFAGGRADGTVFDRLEADASHLPVGCDGLAVCPYLSGCMDPHWDPAARANFIGLSAHHGPAHLYRAALEALTLESARCITAMVARGIRAERILAVGGGANSALWLRMLADATGLPVTLSRSLEASSLGAGISAAVGAGWFDDFDSAAAAMSATGDTITPDPTAAAPWAAASQRQAAAYRPSA